MIHSLKSFITSTESWCLLAACGGSLSGAGTIHSPYYPRASPHPKTCEWIISQPATKVVILNFTDFDIRNATTCESDYIEVKNNTHLLWTVDVHLQVPSSTNLLQSRSSWQASTPSSSHKSFSRFIMGSQNFSLFSKDVMTVLIIRGKYQVSGFFKQVGLIWEVYVLFTAEGVRFHLFSIWHALCGTVFLW